MTSVLTAALILSRMSVADIVSLFSPPGKPRSANTAALRLLMFLAMGIMILYAFCTLIKY